MSFAVARYRTASVDTASPLKIVIALSQGAVRFLREAVTHHESGRIAQRGKALSRAYAIVSELQATLDPSHAPELCAELDRLYDFVLFSITQANLNADAEPLAPAINVMEQLASGWSELDRG
jgi:flagellar protein FliS